MFIFMLNIMLSHSNKNKTIYTHIIAVSKKLNNEIFQKVADRVKKDFGVELDQNTGKISDPDNFLSIEFAEVLD